MERLWQAEQGRGGLMLRPRPERKDSATFDEKIIEWGRVTDEGRFEDGLLILDEAVADCPRHQ